MRRFRVTTAVLLASFSGTAVAQIDMPKFKVREGTMVCADLNQIRTFTQLVLEGDKVAAGHILKRYCQPIGAGVHGLMEHFSVFGYICFRPDGQPNCLWGDEGAFDEDK